MREKESSRERARAGQREIERDRETERRERWVRKMLCIHNAMNTVIKN